MYPGYQQKPAGVSVLSILSFISGVFWIIGAVVVFAIFGGLFIGPTDPTGGGLLTIAAICSGAFFLFGVVAFVIGWGLWTLQGWAWTVAVIFAIIGLINFPIGTIISVIILLYLFKPEIKAVFGKGPPPLYAPPGYAYPPYGPPGAPPYPPPSPPVQPSRPAFTIPGAPASPTCRNCGAPLGPGATFCSTCGTRVP